MLKRFLFPYHFLSTAQTWKYKFRSHACSMVFYWFAQSGHMDSFSGKTLIPDPFPQILGLQPAPVLTPLSAELEIIFRGFLLQVKLAGLRRWETFLEIFSEVCETAHFKSTGMTAEFFFFSWIHKFYFLTEKRELRALLFSCVWSSEGQLGTLCMSDEIKNLGRMCFHIYQDRNSLNVHTHLSQLPPISSGCHFFWELDHFSSEEINPTEIRTKRPSVLGFFLARLETYRPIKIKSTGSLKPILELPTERWNKPTCLQKPRGKCFQRAFYASSFWASNLRKTSQFGLRSTSKTKSWMKKGKLLRLKVAQSVWTEREAMLTLFKLLMSLSAVWEPKCFCQVLHKCVKCIFLLFVCKRYEETHLLNMGEKQRLWIPKDLMLDPKMGWVPFHPNTLYPDSRLIRKKYHRAFFLSFLF